MSQRVSIGNFCKDCGEYFELVVVRGEEIVLYEEIQAGLVRHTALLRRREERERLEAERKRQETWRKEQEERGPFGPQEPLGPEEVVTIEQFCMTCWSYFNDAAREGKAHIIQGENPSLPQAVLEPYTEPAPWN